MKLDAYDTFADTVIEFPLDESKTYRVPVPDFETGHRITRLVSTASVPEGSEDDPDWLWKMLLGPVYDEMVADRVPDAFLLRAGQTAAEHFLNGRDAAIKMWREGPDPLEWAAAQEAARRLQQTGEVSTLSPSTGGASKTRSRASSKGTTSPTT